jgi:hypothetical protein
MRLRRALYLPRTWAALLRECLLGVYLSVAKLENLINYCHVWCACDVLLTHMHIRRDEVLRVAYNQAHIHAERILKQASICVALARRSTYTRPSLSRALAQCIWVKVPWAVISNKDDEEPLALCMHLYLLYELINFLQLALQSWRTAHTRSWVVLSDGCDFSQKRAGRRRKQIPKVRA